MKYLKTFILSLFILVSGVFWVEAGWEDDFGGGAWAPSVRYCNWDECGLQQGTELIKNSLWDIETERSASQYIQDIVAYLLTFLALIAVIYIIYAGFNIMIWNGDEEKLTKAKKAMISFVGSSFFL